jgi:hypothetical protein
MLIIFIIIFNIVEIDFLNVESQICMLIMPIIHIMHQVVTIFWLDMQLMGYGGLFIDEYNFKFIHIGGGKR